MKEVELKLVSELIKNARRSDRELAKAIGVSQPTISRTIARRARPCQTPNANHTK